MTTPQAHAEPLAFERIVFFSDAVFAIAITLLVLEIKVPHIPHEAGATETLVELAKLIPRFVGFLVSFIVLGSFWIEHHRIFRYIERFDAGLLWRNLAMLLAVAFVPFPTALFSEYYTNSVALAVYAVTLTAVGLSKIWIWRYAAAGGRHLPAGIDPAIIRSISWRSWAVPITTMGVAIGALMGSSMAYIGFAFIPLVAWLLGKGAKAAVVVVLLLPVWLAAATSPQAGPLAPLTFLTGCWERRGRTTIVEEQWMRPRGNLMLGMGRTTRGDSVLDFEQVLIRATAGRVQYEANPAGQAPNTFIARTVSDSFVIFVDPEHDFPQAVGYRKRGNDSLIAFIAGTRGGRTDTINFPYARVGCVDGR